MSSFSPKTAEITGYAVCYFPINVQADKKCYTIYYYKELRSQLLCTIYRFL